jgi:DNA-binding response OmpR family regulator
MADVDLARLKVLIVEDQPEMGRILGDVLRELGVSEVRLAGDAADAFEVFQKFDADLILTDWSPGLNGIEFLATLRRSGLSRNNGVPVLMVSSFADPEHVRRARDAGIHEFLAKPVTASRIRNRIQAIFENPRPFVRAPAYVGPDRRRRAERRRAQAPIPFPDRRRPEDPDRRCSLPPHKTPGGIGPPPSPPPMGEG